MAIRGESQLSARVYAPLYAGTAMGLCENVYRRGAVYWWRGRFGPKGEASRTVAVSLRTRDPERARALGARLTGMALRVREQVRVGAMSIGDVREHFIEAGPGKRFYYDPAVFNHISEADTGREAEPVGLPYTLGREREMLAAFGRRVFDKLHRRAADVRARRPLVFADGATDPVGEAIETDRVQGQACRLLGLMGASAHVEPGERASLRDKGLSEREIDRVDAVARRHGRVEDTQDWLIGPERAVLVHHLDASGVAPTDTNVRRLRAGALCLMAELFERTADRYAVVASHVSDIAAEIMREPDSIVRPAEAPILSRAPEPVASKRAPEAADRHSVIEEQHTPKPAKDTRPPASFMALVEALVRSKTNPKARAWEPETARQHLSIARLFTKVALTDDPRQMSQAHIGAYISLLSRMPTHWGKSPDDADRSIDEIMARVEDLEEDEVGLAAPTINRHRTQLSTILAHLEENGYPIGTVSKKSVAKDDRSPDEKRRAFSVEEGRKLIAGPPWTLDDQIGSLTYPRLKHTDAQFWVFLLAWYMMMRLGEVCGLLVSEVDVLAEEVAIRHNKLRRVKNKSSIRTLSIHPELLRIGFAHYIEQQKVLGHEALFPEFWGSATAATVKFNKEWTQVLDAALPDAREQRKTMHSTRKGGNSAMISGKVIDAVRYYMLGHVKSDVHGKHYFDKPSREAMLDAYAHIPIITASLPRLA